MKIYITGVSGVGKSTLVEELKKRGITSFDLDSVPDLCHWRNKKTGRKANYYSGIGREWLEAHSYICSIKKLKKLLNPKKTTVVAGAASNQKDFLNLFDKIFLLRCREKVFLKRLTARSGNNNFAKNKSEQEHILSWYKYFENETIKNGAIPINSEEPTSVIADKIIRMIV